MNAKELLNFLNKTFSEKREKFEAFYWTVYTKNPARENTEKMNQYEADLETFKSDKNNISLINVALSNANSTKEEIQRLNDWKKYFTDISIPENLIPLRKEIADVEGRIAEFRSSREEFYIDPYSKEKIKKSRVAMRTMMNTHSDEKVRKAVFHALENLSLGMIDDYLVLVNLRNEYATALGYDDFYDYKVRFEDKMSKAELFSIFDDIFEGTKHAFAKVRELENEKPGLRSPWNYNYFNSGDLVSEEDQYFHIEKILEYWLKTMNAIGADYSGATLRLDLLARDGKYDNGFCHQSLTGKYDEEGVFIAGETNFTCNAVVGQLGSGKIALDTCLHEGGHAFHFANMAQKDYFLNTEFMPMTAASMETHSMFLDSFADTPEWMCNYAYNKDQERYPFSLYEKKKRKEYLSHLTWMNGIMLVPFFEKEVYESKDLDREKLIAISKRVYAKYKDYSVESTYLLSVPHLYSFESSCQYHGYGLAKIALEQWRKYFYEKDGYLIDNPNVGPAMQKVLKKGSSINFQEMLMLATGEELSSGAYIESVSYDLEKHFKLSKERVIDTRRRDQKGSLKVNAKIELWHGERFICDNSDSLEKMISDYNAFLKTQY